MNIDELWEFSDPAASEARFRQALAGADDVSRLILKTQIARTYGLRKEFATAMTILEDVANGLAKTDEPEPRVRYHLELGRVLVSATRPIDADDPERTQSARHEYESAIDLAQRSGLDALAIDGIHMLAFVDPDPAAQLAIARQGLDIAQASTQDKAKAWQASLHHNAGYALHQLGELKAALSEFDQALALREAQGDAQRIHIAHWMRAWTLRHLGRIDEAITIQESLAIEGTDPFVFDELALLYHAKGDTKRADDAEVRAAKLKEH